MKYTTPEAVHEMALNSGGEPLADHDAKVAAIIVNTTRDLVFCNDVMTAALAMSYVRYYDDPKNAESIDNVLAWYQEREKA